MIREGSTVPLVLMGYLNPILRYDLERFARDAVAAGVDGIILPEVPLEESKRYSEVLRKNNLGHILLVTPTTPPDRISAIDEASSGFVYCVSMTGVTGKTGTVVDDYLQNVRSLVHRNPLQIGFGISTPEDAKHLAQFADGVIIGSALIRRLKNGDTDASLAAWVGSLKRALGN